MSRLARWASILTIVGTTMLIVREGPAVASLISSFIRGITGIFDTYRN